MADIEFECPHCQHTLVVDERGAGKEVPCPECGRTLTIPVAADVTDNIAEPTIRFFCPHCGRKTEVDSDLCGGSAFCPHCGKQLVVPTPDEGVAIENGVEPSEPLRLKRDDPLVQQAHVKPCPYCKVLIPDDNVICLSCSTDLRTGRTIETYHTASEKESVGAICAGYVFMLLMPLIGVILGLRITRRRLAMVHGLVILICSSIFLLSWTGCVSAIVIPSFNKAKMESQAKGCLNNLRAIDAAKEQAAMERGWAQGQSFLRGSAQEKLALEYIRDSASIVCPSGGTYSWNPLGQDPTCSIGGLHSL